MKTVKLPFLLGLGLIASAAFSARAQTYDLAWSAIDGGGGTSSGGTFSVTGTIGQPDAGVLTGGNYTLVGGFWSAFAATPSSPAAPQLSVSVSGQNVIISWPSPSTGFTLEQNTSLDPATWQAAPQTVHDNGTVITIIVPAAAGNMFFRLKH